MELDVNSFPDDRDRRRMKGNSTKNQSNNAKNTERHYQRLIQAQQFNPDDGSVVDVLCLYTKQALEAKCESLNGKNCSKRYSDFIKNMNDECQFAANQAVSTEGKTHIPNKFDDALRYGF